VIENYLVNIFLFI